MTPLENAMEVTGWMRTLQIKFKAPHSHVGENGTRCEFCHKPCWVERHDPMNVAAGRIVNRATDRKDEERET